MDEENENENETQNETQNTNIRNLEGSAGEPPNQTVNEQPQFIKGVEGKLPEIDDYVAGDPSNPTVAEYSNYLVALEEYTKEPNRKDYPSESSYREARKKWLASFANWDVLTDDKVVQALSKSNVSAVADLVKPGNMTRYRRSKVRNFTESELEEFVSKARSAYVKGVEEEFESSYSSEDREAARIRARKDAEEQKAGAIERERGALFTVPPFESLVRLDQAYSTPYSMEEPPSRQPRRPRKISVNEWRTLGRNLLAEESSDLYSPQFFEEFKSYLVDTGVLDQKEAIEIYRGDAESASKLLEEWDGMGAWASQKASEGVEVDLADPDTVVDYFNESEEFNLQAADAKTQSRMSLVNFFTSNGLSYTEDYVNRKSEEIANGETTLLQETDKFRENILVREYPEWADAIRAGAPVRDLAQSYISQMATMLEVDENTIDLQDTRLQSVLSGRDEKGNQKMLTLGEQRAYLGKLPEWKQTTQAKKKRAEAAEFILRKFGKV